MAEQRTARLVLRPEHDEWDLIQNHATLIDAVLLPESYVTPYPPGHFYQSQPHTRLADTAKQAALPLWRDPETAGLRSRTVLRLTKLRRLLTTPLARAFSLPLDLALVADPAARRHALQLVLATQAGDETRTPPYFDLDRRDSPAHRLNIALAREAAQASAGQMPTAFVQVTHSRLMKGLLADVAVDYAATQVSRVVLRVRGLKSEQADARELTAYLHAIDAFREHGIETYPDCAGMLGPVLIAGGASGFTTGTRFFKSIGGGLLAAGGGGGGTPLQALPSGSWNEQPRPAGQSAADTRVANLTSLRELTMLAVSDPDQLIASLRTGNSQPIAWASVLAERKRRAA
jgi:hypothetical protein